MDISDYLQVDGELAVFRPRGRVSLRKAVAMLSAALAAARAREARRMLAVTSGLTGFPSPGVVARYFLVREWAEAADGRVRVALVVKPEMVDPFRFGITVARNHGLAADVFVSEEDAVAWLQGGE